MLQHPAKCVWDMDKMREHLIQAFKKKKLDQFPVVKERQVPFGDAIKHSEVVDIYCLVWLIIKIESGTV